MDKDNIAAKSMNNNAVTFISRLENLTLDPGDAAAKIVINSRTGTVCHWSNRHGERYGGNTWNLSVIISEHPFVSQPEALSDGATVVAPSSQISVNQQRGRTFIFGPSASLNDIVAAINKIGVAPGDLVAILEALKTAGALQGELVVIKTRNDLRAKILW